MSGPVVSDPDPLVTCDIEFNVGPRHPCTCHLWYRPIDGCDVVRPCPQHGLKVDASGLAVDLRAAEAVSPDPEVCCICDWKAGDGDDEYISSCSGCGGTICYSCHRVRPDGVNLPYTIYMCEFCKELETNNFVPAMFCHACQSSCLTHCECDPDGYRFFRCRDCRCGECEP